MSNNSTSINLKYGGDCENDKNCDSNICEMTYKYGKPMGRKCVKQKLKYGKTCKTNMDCFSNRCVMTYEGGMPKRKRCIVINNLKRSDTNLFGSDTPAFLKDDKTTKNIKRNPNDFHLNEHMKELELGERGPVAKFAVLIIEIIMDVAIKIFELLGNIWKNIFKFIWNACFGSWDGWLASDKWKKKTIDTEKCEIKYKEQQDLLRKGNCSWDSTGNCNPKTKKELRLEKNELKKMGYKPCLSTKDPYCLQSRKDAIKRFTAKLGRIPTEEELVSYGYPECESIQIFTCTEKPLELIRFTMAILFPPMSVLMTKGLMGWMHILICCVLTAMFYFPGMMYAFIMMNGSNINVCSAMK